MYPKRLTRTRFMLCRREVATAVALYTSSKRAQPSCYLAYMHVLEDILIPLEARSDSAALYIGMRL